MKSAIVMLGIAAAGLGVTAASAAPCSPGYKKVKIDGNYVCALDVNASTKLKLKTK